MLEMSKITEVSGLQDRGLRSRGSFAASLRGVAVDPGGLVVSVHEIVKEAIDVVLDGEQDRLGDGEKGGSEHNISNGSTVFKRSEDEDKLRDDGADRSGLANCLERPGFHLDLQVWRLATSP